MIADEACWKRGCACHDSRVDGPGVELVRKREWVGLTHAQAKECLQAWDENDAYALCRAIEAKLKEKNDR